MFCFYCLQTLFTTPLPCEVRYPVTQLISHFNTFWIKGSIRKKSLAVLGFGESFSLCLYMKGHWVTWSEWKLVGWKIGFRAKSSRCAGNQGRNGKNAIMERNAKDRETEDCEHSSWLVSRLALHETNNCGKVISSRAAVEKNNIVSIVRSVTMPILGRGVTRKHTC